MTPFLVIYYEPPKGRPTRVGHDGLVRVLSLFMCGIWRIIGGSKAGDDVSVRRHGYTNSIRALPSDAAPDGMWIVGMTR